MIFNPLSKIQTIKVLEHGIVIDDDCYGTKKLFNLLIEIGMWYHKRDLKAGADIKKKIILLTRLLGTPYTYTAKYEYQAYIWGLDWDGNQFTVSLSRRGLEIMIFPTFDRSRLLEFLTVLRDCIC